MFPLSRPLQAVWLMIGSMALFAAMSTLIGLLARTMPPAQIVLIRNVLSLVLIVLWSAAAQKGMPRFPTTHMRGHFWRAAFGIAAMEMWFYSLSILPVTFAIALSFTTPIFSTIFAILFLGERAGVRRWSAIAIGFLGMLVILRPDLGGVDARASFVLVSSAMMAVAGVLVKSLTRTEPPETIVFYMALFMIPWSALPAAFVWQSFTLNEFWLVFLIALFSTAAHQLLARAFVRTDMVTLMPFDFTRLIFAALFAWILFGETLDAATLLGSLIIVGSTVYIAHREAKKRPPGVT